MGDALGLLIGFYVWIRVMGWLAPIVGPMWAVGIGLGTAVVGLYGFSWWVDRKRGS